MIKWLVAVKIIKLRKSLQRRSFRLEQFLHFIWSSGRWKLLIFSWAWSIELYRSVEALGWRMWTNPENISKCISLLLGYVNFYGRNCQRTFCRTYIYVICRLGGPYSEKLWPGSFSSPRSQFFTIRTDAKPVNNLFIFFQALTRKKTHGKNLRKRYCDRGQW